MANFIKTVRRVVFLGIALALPLGLIGCVSGSNTSPTLPSQIPIAVEYAGETIAGDIAVETGQTALFTVTDSSGNVVDPALITAEVMEPSASLSLAKDLLFDVSLGTFSTEGDYVVYTAGNYLPPNQLGQVEAQFTYNGNVIGASTLKISPSVEDINADRYAFTNVYSTEGVYTKVAYPDTAVDGFGNVYVCLLYETAAYTDDRMDFHSATTRAVLKRGSYTEASGVNITWQTDEWDAEVVTGARYCNVLVFNESGSADATKVALTTEDYNGISLNGSSELVISTDGGKTFGDPIPISYSVYDAKFDQNGNIHMAALDVTGCQRGQFNVKYLEYDGATVIDKGNASDCKSGNEQKPQIAVSSDGETAYLVWQDPRATFDSPGQWIADTYLAVMGPSGTTEVRLRPVDCAQSLCLAGYEVDIVMDRLGQPVISWNDFTADGWPDAVSNIVMKTYLAVLDPQTDQATYTLLATTSDIDTDQGLSFSKNSVVADYSNNYHVFFRDQQALRYVMMRTADGLTTTPIVPISEAIGVTGHTNAATDLSGRNYVIWKLTTEDYDSSSVEMMVGTLRQQ